MLPLLLSRHHLLPSALVSRVFFSSHSKAISMSYNRVGELNNNQLPLVIGHGLFGQKQNWNSVSKALNKRLNTPIYVIDFRNHGESAWTDEHTYDLLADDLAKFVEDVVRKESGHSQINLLGHSMGGKAVAHFAVRQPGQQFINKLIVEDVTPTRSSSPSLFHGYVEALQRVDLNKSRKEILIDLEEVVPDLKVRQFMLTNLTVDPLGAQRFKWKVNLAGVGRSLQHVITFKIEQGTFTGPTLFLYGENSDFVTEKDKHQIRNLFPNVRFKSLSTGHWVHADEPGLFVDAVVEFLSDN